jgi:hypothetical protein
MGGLADRDHVIAVAPQQHQAVVRPGEVIRTRGYG